MNEKKLLSNLHEPAETDQPEESSSHTDESLETVRDKSTTEPIQGKKRFGSSEEVPTVHTKIQVGDNTSMEEKNVDDRSTTHKPGPVFGGSVDNPTMPYGRILAPQKSDLFEEEVTDFKTNGIKPNAPLEASKQDELETEPETETERPKPKAPLKTSKQDELETEPETEMNNLVQRHRLSIDKKPELVRSLTNAQPPKRIQVPSHAQTRLKSNSDSMVREEPPSQEEFQIRRSSAWFWWILLLVLLLIAGLVLWRTEVF